MKINQSNETTMKVVFIMIMTLTDNKDHRKINNVSLHHRQN